jgi:hypothetical protein
MEAKYIITLREPINTGLGVTAVLRVKDFSIDTEAGMVDYHLEHGEGVLPLKNIAGIYPVKPSK